MRADFGLTSPVRHKSKEDFLTHLQVLSFKKQDAKNKKPIDLFLEDMNHDEYGNSFNDSPINNWDYNVLAILDTYRLPLCLRECVEQYIFAKILDIGLIQPVTIREYRTPMGRRTAIISVDIMPSKTQWDQLFLDLKKVDMTSNQKFGATVPIHTRKDLKLDMLLIDKTVEKLKKNKTGSGNDGQVYWGEDEPYRLLDIDVLTEVFGDVDKKDEDKMINNLQKRRGLARKDAKKFFGSERLDF